MGNILPGVLSVPATFAGLFLFKVDNPFSALPLGLMFGGPIIGWFLVNALGLYENSAMRAEIGRKLDRELGAEQRRQIFMGYSTPKFRSILDPHEFIGFLIIEPDKWIIFGENSKQEILVKDMMGIKWKKNTHSAMLLGGFMQLDHRDQTGVKTLLFESRDKATLLANRKITRALIKEFGNEPKPAKQKTGANP